MAGSFAEEGLSYKERQRRIDSPIGEGRASYWATVSLKNAVNWRRGKLCGNEAA